MLPREGRKSCNSNLEPGFPRPRSLDIQQRCGILRAATLPAVQPSPFLRPFVRLQGRHSVVPDPMQGKSRLMNLDRFHQAVSRGSKLRIDSCRLSATRNKLNAGFRAAVGVWMIFLNDYRESKTCRGIVMLASLWRIVRGFYDYIYGIASLQLASVIARVVTLCAQSESDAMLV